MLQVLIHFNVKRVIFLNMQLLQYKDQCCCAINMQFYRGFHFQILCNDSVFFMFPYHQAHRCLSSNYSDLSHMIYTKQIIF